MELCRNPATMEKLVAEVDRFVARKGDTPMVYADLKELPYMYGSQDMSFDQVSRSAQLCATPHAPQDVLILGPVLIRC